MATFGLKIERVTHGLEQQVRWRASDGKEIFGASEGRLLEITETLRVLGRSELNP